LHGVGALSTFRTGDSDVRIFFVLFRVDQERAATNARIDRVEGDVETNKNEIKRIKTKLAMDA